MINRNIVSVIINKNENKNKIPFFIWKFENSS